MAALYIAILYSVCVTNFGHLLIKKSLIHDMCTFMHPWTSLFGGIWCSGITAFYFCVLGSWNQGCAFYSSYSRKNVLPLFSKNNKTMMWFISFNVLSGNIIFVLSGNMYFSVASGF